MQTQYKFMQTSYKFMQTSIQYKFTPIHAKFIQNMIQYKFRQTSYKSDTNSMQINLAMSSHVFRSHVPTCFQSLGLSCFQRPCLQCRCMLSEAMSSHIFRGHVLICFQRLCRQIFGIAFVGTEFEFRSLVSAASLQSWSSDTSTSGLSSFSAAERLTSRLITPRLEFRTGVTYTNSHNTWNV